jgi:predicted amidohydrolase YtcJ
MQGILAAQPRLLMNMENEIGSIELGKLADLIVVDKNLFDLDTYEIHKTQVDMTMMNGKVVYQREH